MEQHAVPQNISSYQFHLVGDMTLKQFLELAGGVVVGLLFYATGLPSFIKWPLILLSAAMGAALAFIPFEERPLEQWIIAFFRSVYSPTLFYWKKPATPPVYFQAEQGATNLPSTTLIPKTGFLANLENSENVFLSKVSQLFGTTTQVSTKPQAVEVIEPTPVTPQAPIGTATLSTQRPQVNVPATPVVQVASSDTPPKVIFETPDIKPIIPEAASTNNQFAGGGIPPTTPTTPNVVVGEVTDLEGKIIESAILEIRDVLNRPVRALRTNKAGHFMIVTPLQNGKYQLMAEKDGFIFDAHPFEATGAIVAPITIRARARQIATNELIQ